MQSFQRFEARLVALLALAAFAALAQDPAPNPEIENPALPRVLLIGDSISMGYTVPVRRLLQATANLKCLVTSRQSLRLHADRGTAKFIAQRKRSGKPHSRARGGSQRRHDGEPETSRRAKQDPVVGKLQLSATIAVTKPVTYFQPFLNPRAAVSTDRSRREGRWESRKSSLALRFCCHVGYDNNPFLFASPGNALIIPFWPLPPGRHRDRCLHRKRQSVTVLAGALFLSA